MYALRYPRFVKAFSTGTYETADGSYLFRNNNRMLRTYEGIVGGKTGYDDDAGWCLINVAERNGRRVIAVTMNGVAPDDWYDDNRVLLDYALEQQALRAETGAGVTGEVLRFRDPDAAIILAMGSAGGTIGEPALIAAAEEALAGPQAIPVPGSDWAPAERAGSPRSRCRRIDRGTRARNLAPAATTALEWSQPGILDSESRT